jgi:hypothetical protein
LILSSGKVIEVEPLAATGTLPVNGANADSLRADLPEDPKEWERMRLRKELLLAVQVRRKVRARKGTQWRAEFMRLMYPHVKAANAKGFNDLIRRLTTGPWGSPDLRSDPVAGPLLEELQTP